MAIESPTVYVNPYYVAIPYLQTQMVSKHYYMGSQRVASSMAEVPSQIASPPASGGGEGGEEFASANLSSPDDPVIIDFISTMNCVYNASIDLAFDESLSMPELDQINFHNCEGVAFPPEELAQEDPMCLCEQSVYWGNIYGADCSSRNVMYWYHPDYLGSVEAITDVRGEVYQFFHNTIWGEPLQDQKAFTYKDFSSRFRFNGKERDEETGNYYYGARYYDPKISVWLSVDPMASSYPHLTSYNFLENNPIMFVDPTGMNSSPVFNGDGDFLGTTESGYKGEILVMTEDDFTQDMDDNEALNKGTKLKDANISKHADSKILSHVANRRLDDGLNHDEYIDVNHDPDYVQNGWSIGKSNFRYLGKDEEGNMFNILSGSGWREGSYESTVENLRSSINIHEVDGHGKNKISQGADHFEAYQMQIMNPQWNTTTLKYRKSRTTAFLKLLRRAGHPEPAKNSPIGKRLVH